MDPNVFRAQLRTAYPEDYFHSQKLALCLHGDRVVDILSKTPHTLLKTTNLIQDVIKIKNVIFFSPEQICSFLIAYHQFHKNNNFTILLKIKQQLR